MIKFTGQVPCYLFCLKLVKTGLKNKTPKEIIRQFFEELMADKSEEERHDLLFKMVQYIERQVVLFDSIEDASFEKFNDIKGKGTMTALIARAENDHKKMN